MGDNPASSAEHGLSYVHHALTQRECAEISSRCAALATDIFRRIPSRFAEISLAIRDRTCSAGILHAASDDVSPAAIAERVVRLAYTRWVLGGCRSDLERVFGLDGQDELASPLDGG